MKHQQNPSDFKSRLGMPIESRGQAVPGHSSVFVRYSIFDNLEFQGDVADVTLSGHVTWPALKSDAAIAVKRIEGVQSAIQNVEVQPLARFDNRIRIATYRAVFGAGGLHRSAMGENPSIYIIVDNRHVTLVGMVGTQMDKTLAGVSANSVPGVLSVTNNLVVEGCSNRTWLTNPWLLSNNKSNLAILQTGLHSQSSLRKLSIKMT